jgi:threonine dehydrogenase-like Zn-dependent dehydrogenase
VAPTNRYVAEVGPLVASGELDPSPIVTDVYALDELPAAFAAMDERRTVKAILHPDA